MKTKSIFYSNKNININIEKYNEVENNASWWMKKSYDELYKLMFSNSLLRSWFVLSYGNCPKCGKSVLLYNWKLDAKNHPYKVQCPHCESLFPENDFGTFYQSGLDSDGRFSYDLADRSLLGDGPFIDDGNGYIHNDGENYRFIAYYMTRGHWEQLITEGINTLSLAYLATKNKEYARRAMLLFYSVSRFYSDFDFFSEGLMYENKNWSNGYVNYWVTSCNDMKSFAISYDMIFDGVKNDTILEDYLKLPFKEIQKSVEENIFIDATKNTKKIFSNPPATDMALLYIKIILSYDEKKQEIFEDLDALLKENTLVDGLPGEKGVSGYTAIGPRLVLEMLSQLSLINDHILTDLLTKYPVLYKTYRFHIDCWYQNMYYPHCGDTGIFNEKITKNISLKSHTNDISLNLIKPSPAYLCYLLYKHFNDSDFLKVIYINNDYSFDGLFKNDFFLTDEQKSIVISTIKEIISKEGSYTNQISINYEQFRLALLHDGKNENSRMAFVLYESGANHSHNEALNFGLFFKGKNIISGFGYPPVGYGGWDSNNVKWYWHANSHNIVVIDNKDHINKPPKEWFLRYPKYGKTLLFEHNKMYQAICVQAKEYADAKVFERLIAMVNIDEKDSYVIDIFKVEGGNNHRKFQRSSFMNIDSSQLTLENAVFPEYEFMRNFKSGKQVDTPYSVTFYDDEVNFKYTDLTEDVTPTICESWVDKSTRANSKQEKESLWIPTLMIESNGPKTSYVSIMEVYNSNARVIDIKRTGDDNNITLTVTLDNGKIDEIRFTLDHQFSVIRK